MSCHRITPRLVRGDHDLSGTLVAPFRSSDTSRARYRIIHHALLTFSPLPAYARSLPRNRTAWPYFCSLVMSWSPWRTTSWYCLFLSSGRFVSMMPLPATRSMVQGMRPAAMNLARSLQAKQVSKFRRVCIRNQQRYSKIKLTGPKSRPSRQSRWPCCRARQRGSSAAAAGRRAGAFRE